MDAMDRKFMEEACGSGKLLWTKCRSVRSLFIRAIYARGHNQRESMGDPLPMPKFLPCVRLLPGGKLAVARDDALCNAGALSDVCGGDG